MAEVGERHLNTSELARELKSQFPHLIADIEKLEQMLFGDHLHRALQELADRVQFTAGMLAREALQELAPETAQANQDN